MPELAYADPTNVLPAEARGDLAVHALHDASVELDTQEPLYDPHEIGIPRITPSGEQLDIVAEASINDKDGNVAFIRSRSAYGDQLFIVGLESDRNGAQKAVGIWHPLAEAVPFILGRGDQANMRSLNGRDFGDGVSRKHLTATVTDGRLSLEDTSLNGSTYKGNQALPAESYDYEGIHTVTAEEAARMRGFLKEESDNGPREFGGRPVINRDTFPIDGHVDIRSWVAGGEAIVVDSKKYPKEFDELRASFQNNLAKFNGRKFIKLTTEERVLRAIYETVDEAMDYDLKFVDKESESLHNESPNQRKAALNNYLSAGKGVCRHMALAVSWLGGEAYQQGLLSGRFTTEVNQNNQGNGAHEWSRYTSESGEVYILDVAQHYVGRLSETVERKANGRDFWGYFRNSQERDAYRQARAGRAVLNLGALVQTPPRGNRLIRSEDVPK